MPGLAIYHKFLHRLKLSGKYKNLNFGKKLVYLSWKKYAWRFEIYYSFWINRNALYCVNFDDHILSTVHDTKPYLQVNDLRSYNEKVEHYLKTHLDDEAISKLYHNEKLTSQDLLALETLLWEKLGSKSDYQQHYENKAIPRLVREIIGLDREAANQVFSKFLSDESLNAKQISFVKLIVDYIVENGCLETKVLTQEPFKSYGSVQLLFQHQLPILLVILSKQLNSLMIELEKQRK